MAYDSSAVAKNGIADLRHQNFEKELALKGEWLFAWHQLVTPADKNIFKHTIPFPGLWKDQQVNGEHLGSVGYASYGLTILLPRHHPLLAMYLPVGKALGKQPCHEPGCREQEPVAP